jgi:hypothetical protein
MKTLPQRLILENDSITGYVNFVPEFTKSEKSMLRRFGYAPLPGSQFLHSSQGKWIQKIERVDYVVNYEDTKLTGVTETNRILVYALAERRPGSYSNTIILENTDFKLFAKRLKKMYDQEKK